MSIKVRNCPSPTWKLHIWTLRTSLYNYLFAKKNWWKIVFRSEDTDKERSKKEFEEDIINWLKNLWITYDEWPFRQSERSDIYKKYIEKLLESWEAYYCFMTREELEGIRSEQIAKKEPTRYPNTYRDFPLEEAEKLFKEWKTAVIRLKLPDKEIVFKDLIKWEIKIHTKELWWDFVIAKDLNTPLYNFTVVIDDYEMWITHVLRWEDHISNTPKQICIYEKLWVKNPEFWHFPLILNPDWTKLSKRRNRVSVQDYLDEWYLPEAVLNFLVLLWWSSKSEEEFFTMKKLEKAFSLDWVNKSWAKFDIKKLNFINSHYIKQMSFDELSEKIEPFLNKELLKIKYKNWAKFQELIQHVHDRLEKLSDINDDLRWFYAVKDLNPSLLENKKMKVTCENAKETLVELVSFLENLDEEDFKVHVLKEKLIELIKKKEVKVPFVMWPLRVALSREEFSPWWPELMEILWKSESIKRVKEIINN